MLLMLGLGLGACQNDDMPSDSDGIVDGAEDSGSAEPAMVERESSAESASNTGSTLANPNAGPQRAEPPTDDAISCPIGLAPVVKNNNANFVTAQPNQCLVLLGGADFAQDNAPGSGAIFAGSGNDNVQATGPSLITLGAGNDWLSASGPGLEVYGQDGVDTVSISDARGAIVRAGVGNDWINSFSGFGVDVDAGSGDDFANVTGDHGLVRGRSGADRLNVNGADTLVEGNHGDDVLVASGNGIVAAPGHGRDDVTVSGNNTTVILYHACEVASGESLRGNGPSDTLVTALSLADLASAGVTVEGFEKVLVIPADAVDCGPTCDCPGVVAPPVAETCNFDALSDPDDRAIAENICLGVANDVTSDMFSSLPETPSDDDVKPIIAQFLAQHPAVVNQGSSLSFIMTGGPFNPLQSHQPPGTPQPLVDHTDSPCDLPSEPLDVGVGVGGFKRNCTAGEEDIIRTDLRRAKFNLWRSRQAIHAVVNAPTQAAAEALWNQGIGPLSAKAWFGDYDAARVAAVKATLDDAWDTLHGNWAGGTRMHTQCWHPLTW